MVQNSKLLPMLFVTVLAGVSTVLLIMQFTPLRIEEQRLSSSFRSVEESKSLTNVSEKSHMHVSSEIEPGSDAFYALPSTRKNLIDEAKQADRELQQALLTAGEPLDSSRVMTRALMGYLPPTEERFMSELKWFYLSIGYMRSTQPANMKTDLIVFTEPSNVDKVVAEFNCLRTYRTSASDPEACIVIAHVPLKHREVRAGDAKPPLVEYSNYVDSMLILAEFPTDSAYEMLLRSDLDTFVTPGFSDWNLTGKFVIATGSGGYGSENVNRHLSWTMTQRLGLKDEGLIGLGSTWYGRSSVMIATAKLTIASMNWLHTQEFNEYEQFHAGTDGWPYVFFTYPAHNYL